MKTKPERSIAMQPLLASAGAAALTLGMAAAATPANAIIVTPNNDNVTTAGETGPGITVVTVDQTVTATNTVSFGPELGEDSTSPDFTASLDAGGNLVITSNKIGSNVLNVDATSGDLLDLGLGGAIPGSGSFEGSGTEPNTATLESGDTDVYYGLEFAFGQFGGEDQGWVEVAYDQPVILQYAYGSSVPEPGSLSLFAVGAAAVLARRRRKPATAA
jgi:hypothetical protein